MSPFNNLQELSKIYSALQQRSEFFSVDQLAQQLKGRKHLTDTSQALELIENWEASFKIFSIRGIGQNNSERLYPQYLFDENMEPIEKTNALIQPLLGSLSALQTAIWFATPSPSLGAKSPLQALETDFEKVLLDMQQYLRVKAKNE